MNEFSALITSFGDQLVGHLGKGHLAGLVVLGYPESGQADVEIRLNRNDWDEQLRAIELIADVRMLFIDELSFSYKFVAEKEDLDLLRPAQESSPAYTMA